MAIEACKSNFKQLMKFSCRNFHILIQAEFICELPSHASPFFQLIYVSETEIVSCIYLSTISVINRHSYTEYHKLFLTELVTQSNHSDSWPKKNHCGITTASTWNIKSGPGLYLTWSFMWPFSTVGVIHNTVPLLCGLNYGYELGIY